MGNYFSLLWEAKLRSEEKEREANTEPRELPRRPSDRPSWASPSPLSADSPEEVVSRESALTSTRRPDPSSEPSSRTSSVTPSPTPNTPAGRPSPLSMSSTLSRDREEPSTVSVDELLVATSFTVD